MKNFNSVFVFLILYVAGGGSLMAYEEPKYQVIEKNGDFEVRQYQSYIVAEAVVESDFEEAGNEGHRLLFAYISGENISQEQMAMTTPVTQEASEFEGEEIEMAIPVNQETAGTGRYRIAFVMPSHHTMESLPIPRDKRIQLKEVPARKVIVIEYSGTWSQDNYDEHYAELLDFIKQNNYTVKGDPVWARYDPPFMPWFLRRNEIMIEVE